MKKNPNHNIIRKNFWKTKGNIRNEVQPNLATIGMDFSPLWKLLFPASKGVEKSGLL